MNKWKEKYKNLESKYYELERLNRILDNNISYFREMLSSTLEEEMKLRRVVEEFSKDKSKIDTDLIDSLYEMIRDNEK